MGRTKRAIEYYVRVDPKRIGLYLGDEAKKLEAYREVCEAMVDQIKRHVDEVGYVVVEAETEVVCEHCGSGWTEGEKSLHNGGCCAKDCDVYEQAEAQETTDET